MSLSRNEIAFRDDKLIPFLKKAMPDVEIIKMNSELAAIGIPDLICLNPWSLGRHPLPWIAIEVKHRATSEIRENQQWWINKLDTIGYAVIVSEDNFETFKEELLDYVI